MLNSQATQADIIARVGDEEIKFPKLDILTLATWAAEIHARESDARKANLSADLSAKEQFDERLKIDLGEPDIYELASRMLEPSRSAKVLQMSLAKRGVADPDAIIRRMPAHQAIDLAMKVMDVTIRVPPSPEESEPSTLADAGPSDNPLSDAPPPTLAG